MLAIEEGIPFRTFEQPLFRRLFTPLNHESDKIVKLQRHQNKDAVLEMGSYAVEATKQEIQNHHIAWTTDHWTGQDKATYTTVTAHWIDGKTWMLKSAVLNFKNLKGRPLARESMKMSWWFFRNIRVKLKTLLFLTQKASRIQQEIWGS